MQYVISASLLLAALIHILPISGVFGLNSVAKLYGVAVTDNNTEILLRHRAVLFGLLGACFALAAMFPVLRPFAFGAGLISTVSFLVVARSVGGYNRQLSRVVAADIIAMASLAIGLVLHVLADGGA
jgi:hypothetical protein